MRVSMVSWAPKRRLASMPVSASGERLARWYAQSARFFLPNARNLPRALFRLCDDAGDLVVYLGCDAVGVGLPPELSLAEGDGPHLLAHAVARDHVARERGDDRAPEGGLDFEHRTLVDDHLQEFLHVIRLAVRARHDVRERVLADEVPIL